MRFIILLTISLIFINLGSSVAQKVGFLEINGNVLQDGKGLEGADIKVLKGTENVDNVLSSNGGKFIINLDLGQNYTIIFSKVNIFLIKWGVFDVSFYVSL